MVNVVTMVTRWQGLGSSSHEKLHSVGQVKGKAGLRSIKPSRDYIVKTHFTRFIFISSLLLELILYPNKK